MTSGELIILDVGHGNCAIIRHGTEAIIIDAPGRPIVARALDELGITSIHALLVSHADSDHLSGAIPILLSDTRPVKHVYVNPDNRNSDAWLQFRIAAGAARKKGTSVHSSLNVEDPGAISLLGTTLQVLYPTPEMCLATNAGMHIDGRRIDPNSMSAVVLVEHEGEKVCLLAADSGYQSLETMIDEKVDLKAAMLVFPHHGGNVGGASDNNLFAKRLVGSVEPRIVIFSNGRGSHGTPRPEIVAGVRDALGGTSPYIACTQLSKNCIDIVPTTPRNLNKQSEGVGKNHCCAGTVSWPLEKNGLEVITNELNKNHSDFVVKEIPRALCRKRSAPMPIKLVPMSHI
jgi:beta-lactamase superfamily II metal-dependent hydrolase